MMKKKKKKTKNQKNKVVIIVIIVLAVILILLIILLLFVFKKGDPVEFSLSYANGNADTWSKEDVTINVDIPDETRVKSVQYTINCDKKCDYVEVKDKKIVISNSGESNVTVLVKSTDRAESTQKILVKIDKNNPTVTLSPNQTSFSSSDPVTVCAVCTDNESGCKAEKVCKTYNKTSNSQTITVEDNIGNKATSPAFSVNIIGGSSNVSANPSCSLSVSKSGLVTASNKNVNGYHGFSSSYSGNSENTKQLNLANGKSEMVTYYVKNSDGKTASCSINVKSTCKCTYRGDDGKCYKTEVKVINDIKSAECANAQRKTNDRCYFYTNEGATCEYSKVS